jgi:DNA replication and repair protein RecF
VPLTLEPGTGFNVLAGQNGQGKTNLLEAIYLACTLRSFRTRRLAELIGFGRNETRLAAAVERGGSIRTYEVALTPTGRQARLDGKAVRPAARYFGGFQVVLFAPEDLMVARGAPGDRRAFLDRAVFQRTPEYLTEAQTYDKVLRSRNAVLRATQGKGGGGGSARDAGRLLAVYDEKLAELGARRAHRRAQLIAEIMPGFSAAFASIARTELAACARYAASWIAPDSDLADEAGLAAQLAAALARSRPADLARAVTTVGPHRDDLELTLDGRSVAAFASQGQLRALVLAWKVAELELLERTHGETPILLLDDVSSELDPQRNEYLFDFLSAKKTQCFVTTTHRRYVLATEQRVDYEVRSGGVTRQNAE